MERLSCLLLQTKSLQIFSHYTTTTTSLCRRSINQIIFQRHCSSSKLQRASRILPKQTSSLLISHNLRSHVHVFEDVFLKTGLIRGHYGTKFIHLSRRRDALPPIMWLPFITKALAALTGRKYRNWLKEQSPEVQKKHWRGIYAAFACLFSFMISIGALYYHIHTQEAPLTGRKRLITLTKEQYMKVAAFETQSFIDEFGSRNQLLPPDDPKVGLVAKVVTRICKANADFPNISGPEWTVYVVKDNVKNAFVLPNGTMFVFTGMLDFVQNEDQLAFILAHEMAHALLMHGAEQLSYSQFLDYFVVVVMAALWLVIPSDGIAIVTNWFYKKVMNITVHMPYSRVLEKEADRVGLHLLAKACYDTREGSVLWQRMSIFDDINLIVDKETKLPEWISTHPTHDNRVKYIDHLIPKVDIERTKSNCPPLPNLDPRREVIRLRKVTNNALVHAATKSNPSRTHVDHVNRLKQGVK